MSGIQPPTTAPALTTNGRDTTTILGRQLEAAEHVIEAARYHRNDAGARHLDQALREYDE